MNWTKAIAPMPIYHVWFSTKNRKWLLQGDVADMVKGLFTDAAHDKDMQLLAAETAIDHVHLLLAAESETQLSWFMKLLKGRASYELFRAIPDVKIDGGVNALWQRGFRSRIVPEEQVATVRRYIETQDQRLEKFER